MKKIFCALALSILCLTGCQSNKSKSVDITKTWKSGEQKKDFYKKDLGNPDEENEKEDWDELIWRDYPINDSYNGLLTLQYHKDMDLKDGNYYFIDWIWSAIGTKDDFLKIYNYYVNQYGKPLSSLCNNTIVTFDIREITSDDNRIFYSDGDHLGLVLKYKEDTNTIELTWPVTLSPEDLSTSEEES